MCGCVCCVHVVMPEVGVLTACMLVYVSGWIYGWRSKYSTKLELCTTYSFMHAQSHNIIILPFAVSISSFVHSGAPSKDDCSFNISETGDTTVCGVKAEDELRSTAQDPMADISEADQQEADGAREQGRGLAAVAIILQAVRCWIARSVYFELLGI